MSLSHPVPFEEAITYLRGRGLLRTTLNATQLAELESEFRRHAVFSSKVTKADIINGITDIVSKVLDPQYAGGEPGTAIDIPRARELLRQIVVSTGYAPEPGTEGTLQDLLSHARTDIIIRTNTQLAEGLGEHIQSNTTGALEAFPAKELVRIQGRKKPRGGPTGDQFSASTGYGGVYWPGKWSEAGGKFYGGGRMIALVNDPIWERISRFKNPYPPFDYNSGLWTNPVARREAIAFGLIKPGERVTPSTITALPPAQAGIAGLTKPILDALRASVPGAIVKDGVLTTEENHE